MLELTAFDVFAVTEQKCIPDCFKYDLRDVIRAFHNSLIQIFDKIWGTYCKIPHSSAPTAKSHEALDLENGENILKIVPVCLYIHLNNYDRSNL